MPPAPGVVAMPSGCWQRRSGPSPVTRRAAQERTDPPAQAANRVALPDCLQMLNDLLAERAKSFAAVLVPFCASLADAQKCGPATS